MDEIKTLEQEKRELNALINKGVSFEVEDFDIEEKRVFFGLIKKRVPVKVMRKFRIEEPVLSTLDRLTAEGIEIAIDEAALQSDDTMRRIRTLVASHSIRCAKYVALAVLGSDYLIPKCTRNGVIRYAENTERLNHLTALFARTIKPSKLHQLSVLINAMSNHGDFMNSIRLMSADRTTMPIRIEGNSEG